MINICDFFIIIFTRKVSGPAVVENYRVLRCHDSRVSRHILPGLRCVPLVMVPNIRSKFRIGNWKLPTIENTVELASGLTVVSEFPSI